MRRLAIEPRADWKAEAARLGGDFLSEGGDSFWTEDACYAFTLQEIEEAIEAPTQELLSMCYAAVEHVVGRPDLLRKLAIPESVWDYLRRSWQRQDRDLYGRFDLRFDGTAPAKLYEFNADTPTSLFEAAVFQWHWLEQGIEHGRLPHGADQFNSIHDRLIEAFAGFGFGKAPLHVACVRDNAEDRGTVDYLAECARQAGVSTEFIFIEEIGVTADGRFTDLADRAILNLFKLYPWEWMVSEAFGRHLPGDRTRFIEPVWKMVLSNKGLLPILWEMFPGHPNLLPAFFEGDPRAQALAGNHVRKPLHGREGGNIEIVRRGPATGGLGTDDLRREGPYGGEGYVVQSLCELPDFDGNRPVIGSWVVAGQACGMGIREERAAITSNGARFVPHVILD
jgi:glutathionylspermidine synthase